MVPTCHFLLFCLPSFLTLALSLILGYQRPFYAVRKMNISFHSLSSLTDGSAHSTNPDSLSSILGDLFIPDSCSQDGHGNLEQLETRRRMSLYTLSTQLRPVNHYFLPALFPVVCFHLRHSISFFAHSRLKEVLKELGKSEQVVY